MRGFRYLEQFVYDDLDEKAPVWTFHVSEVTVRKHLLMVHGKNTVALWYELDNPSGKEVSLELTPLFRFTSKKEEFDAVQQLEEYKLALCDEAAAGAQDKQYCITGGIGSFILRRMRHCHKSRRICLERCISRRMRRDGRVAFGNAFVNCTLNCTSKNIYLLLSAEKPDACAQECYHEFMRQNSARKSQLLTQANLSSDLGRQLVLSADAYVVRRDSTDGKSIIAGYPFLRTGDGIP